MTADVSDSAATEREALLDSAATFSRYHWIMLRNFCAASTKHFGDEAWPVLERGFRRYGRYRGEHLRDTPGVLVDGREPASLFRHWDGVDFALPHAVDYVQISGTAAEAQLILPRVPGSDYFAEKGSGEALEPYWRNVLEGFAEGFDPRLRVEWGEISEDPMLPWTTVWRHAGGSSDIPISQFEDIFGDAHKAITAIRRTTGLLAAFQMYVSRELIDSFDASGENAVREASYGFGAERGAAIREQHLAEGRPLTMLSFMGGLQQRDPAAAIFAFRGPGYLSEGVWHADCTYCPLAEVWAEEGVDGLRLGYLFDAPNHRGLFESYHPGVVVRWDAVKSRGDPVCKFRFFIPELMTSEDPSPGEEPSGKSRPFIESAER